MYCGVMAELESGNISTPFLLTRLPRWAGVRQNIVGSDLTGRPVPGFVPPANTVAALDVKASVPAAPGTTVEESMDLDDALGTTTAQLVTLQQTVIELSEKVKTLEEHLRTMTAPPSGPNTSTNEIE